MIPNNADSEYIKALHFHRNKAARDELLGDYGTKGDAGLQFVSIVGSITQTLKKQRRRVFCFLSQALEKPEVLQTI